MRAGCSIRNTSPGPSLQHQRGSCLESVNHSGERTLFDSRSLRELRRSMVQAETHPFQGGGHCKYTPATFECRVELGWIVEVYVVDLCAVSLQLLGSWGLWRARQRTNAVFFGILEQFVGYCTTLIRVNWCNNEEMDIFSRAHLGSHSPRTQR